jgi:hypothetical protein
LCKGGWYNKKIKSKENNFITNTILNKSYKQRAINEMTLLFVPNNLTNLAEVHYILLKDAQKSLVSETYHTHTPTQY